MTDVVLGLGGNHPEVRAAIAERNLTRRPTYDRYSVEVSGVSRLNRTNFFSQDVIADATMVARAMSGLM